MYTQPNGDFQRATLHTGGTLVAMPAAFVWDVATFPVQWAWGIYPFGGTLTPDSSTK